MPVHVQALHIFVYIYSKLADLNLHIHLHLHTHINIYKYIYINIYKYIYIYIHIYIYTNIHIYIYTNIHIYIYLFIYKYMYIYIYICIYIKLYIYINRIYADIPMCYLNSMKNSRLFEQNTARPASPCCWRTRKSSWKETLCLTETMDWPFSSWTKWRFPKIGSTTILILHFVCDFPL